MHRRWDHFAPSYSISNGFREKWDRLISRYTVERCLPIAAAISFTGTFACNMSSIARLSRKSSSVWANSILLAFQQDRGFVAIQFRMCLGYRTKANKKDYGKYSVLPDGPEASLTQAQTRERGRARALTPWSRDAPRTRSTPPRPWRCAPPDRPEDV